MLLCVVGLLTHRAYCMDLMETRLMGACKSKLCNQAEK